MLERRFVKRKMLHTDAKDAVLAVLRETLACIPEIEFAYVHGSFVNESDFRDVDVAVYVTRPSHALRLESDWSFDLSERTGLPVEVRIINNAPVPFQMACLRHGTVLVANSQTKLTDFIERVGRRYREYKHFRNLFLAA